MKKRYLLLGLLLTGTGLLSSLLLKPALNHDILLNKLPDASNFQMTVFYSDITMNTVKGYNIRKDMITPLKKRFKSYTEGFLPQEKHQALMLAINSFRKSLGKEPLTYFHDFYEDQELAIVSFTGGLENIYIIDKKSNTVQTLKYNEQDNLGSMYVSHIRRIADTFVLAGGEVNAYNAFIYTIDAKTGVVIKAQKISTHPSAIYEEHYVIDQSGNALFVSGNGLDILPYKANNTIFKPLPFETQYVFSNGSHSVALSLDSNIMHYTLLDENLDVYQSGELPLPSEHVILVNAFLKDRNLYLISYDPIHRRYRNYIAVYSLDTNKIVYCLALYQHSPLALLNGQIN